MAKARMMRVGDTEMPSDADLVAYLDGELDRSARARIEAAVGADIALKERLDRLAAGGRGLADAFDLLLGSAPAARLEAGLARAVAAERAAHSGWRRGIMAVAAALVLFVVGAATGHFLPNVRDLAGGSSEQASETWRVVVAEYLTLYTNETLADIPDDPALKAAELKRVGDRLGVALDADKVRLANLDLKRAQLFDLNGAPLAQIAYLSDRDGPVAFCIIKSGEPDAKPEFEARQGKNIVYWAKGGRGFMLIGKTPRATLEGLAGQLAERVS